MNKPRLAGKRVKEIIIANACETYEHLEAMGLRCPATLTGPKRTKEGYAEQCLNDVLSQQIAVLMYLDEVEERLQRLEEK